MAAGLNIKVRIWKIQYSPDDAVGGSVITGTVVGDYQSRFRENRESQLLLQQGLEVDKTYSAIIVPGTVDVHERDELEIIQPTDHPYYGQRFRVRGVSFGMLNPRDPRNYVQLTLSRSRIAHAQQ
jgi:hypothetical protein